jgi:asparagine synthase (glutamine-hydrolysing)
MCGIAGAADFRNRRIDEALVRAMCQALRHRGPDDEGVVFFPLAGRPGSRRAAAALGSRRLSIIDLTGGHQPLSNEDGTVWTVCNGEIYNFRELRAELEGKGHRFTTASDCEVIVHLYEERGEDFVSALDGMFALALWDDRTQRLVLARDRFGKKPLLYAQVNGRLLFASEFQALLRDGTLPREVDLAALDDYLAFMAIPAPRTIYRAVRKLPPGHLLILDRRGTTVRPYWRLSYGPKLRLGEGEAAEAVLEALTRAVRKRLVSDVPLGAFLSGGVDSSAVVACMAGLTDRPVKTFSIGFEESDYDELPHARRVARRFGCDHHEFVVRPRAVDVLPTLVRHFGEPFADSSAVPTYYLSRMTREHVTVALSGDGGDEAFAGYGRHLGFRLAEWWQRTPALLRRPLAGATGGLAAGGPGARSLPVRAGRFLNVASRSRPERYRAWAGLFTPEAMRSLRGCALADGAASDALFDEAEGLDAVDAALAADTRFYLPTDLLVKMDIMSMANSLEVRSPFLDRDLVELAARLPSDLKLRRFTSKFVLKKALAARVPAENLSRGKRGFAVPIGGWFRGELRDFLADHLLDARCARVGLVRPAVVAELIADHQAGRRDHAHQLWTLLMLELWHREFIG